MIKIAFDTNIWFSATIGGEISNQLPKILDKSGIKIFTCQEILDEFQDTTARPKSKKLLLPTRIIEIKKLMFYFTEFVTIISPVTPISRDPKDDFLLVLANDYELDFLITGDKDLLILEQYQNTRIITFADFIKHLEFINFV